MKARSETPKGFRSTVSALMEIWAPVAVSPVFVVVILVCYCCCCLALLYFEVNVVSFVVVLFYVLVIKVDVEKVVSAVFDTVVVRREIRSGFVFGI